MASEQHNLWLDLIRGISALLVCLGHLRNALLVDFAAIEHPTLAIKVLYLLTSFGHQAVMVFFVLSGYFVGGGVLRAGANFSWSTYLVSRLTRLWVVLVPCLLLTWCVGEMLSQLDPQALTGAYFDTWHSGPKVGEYAADFTTMLANLFFLQTIVTPVFGLNGPLWSLANEFWYYLLFPLLTVSLGLISQKNMLGRIFSILLAICIIYFMPISMRFGFLIWMMGVGIYILQSKIKPLSQNTVRILLLIALITFGLALACSKSSDWLKVMPIEPDFIIGLTFAFLCFILSNLPFPEVRLPWLARSSLHLSEISYSLYLSHFPIVLLIATTVYESRKFAPDGLLLAQFVGWGFLLLVFGSALWWLFESRTVFVRAKVTSFMLLRMKVFTKK